MPKKFEKEFISYCENQNLEVNAGVAQTVRAEMLNLLPAFKAETISAVAESRLRGGEFASAFSGRK